MADDLTTNATDPDMAADDAAQPLHAQLLALGTEWRSRHVPTERLATHISALGTHAPTKLSRHAYPLQQEEFVLTDMPPVPHRRLAPQRYIISAVAAVVVVALLGAAFLVVTRRVTSTHLPAATLTLPSATTAFIKATDLPFTATVAAPVNSPLLRSLHMIDATTGWAQTDQKILRTTDGGVHWHDVTPPGITLPLAAPQSLIYTALDVTTAWASDGKTIFRTTNGGQAWQMAQPSVEKTIGYLTFIDATHGWAVDFLGVASSHSYLNLLHTSDGGATWTRVTTTDGPGGLPSVGDKSVPVFNNATTGWIGGMEPRQNFIYFYTTNDGGVTWHPQALPPPTSQTYQMATPAPIFFNAQDGVLPVDVSLATTNGTNERYIYVTHNGGSTWSIAPNSYSVLDFLDVSHWWGVGGQSGNDLAYTADGGQHWTTLTPGGTFNNIGQLDFVSPMLGWASTPNYSSLPTLLSRTTDGGHTWQQIDYQVG